VVSVTGACDQGLAACIDDMLTDHRLPTLPRSDDPAGANRDALAALQTLVGLDVPGRSCSPSCCRRAADSTSGRRRHQAPTTSSWSGSTATTRGP
jgi:hypothetical protein